MNARSLRFLFRVGFAWAGLLLALFGIAAYPVKSLSGQSAARFELSIGKHVAPADNSDASLSDSISDSVPAATTPAQDTTASPATATGGSGLAINPVFDTSITSKGNAQAIKAAINNAIAAYESMFSDPITVTILFRYSTTAPDGSALGAKTVAESRFVVYRVPWDTYLSALQADAMTSNDGRLPGYTMSTNVLPSSAGGRAVGLDTPSAMAANGRVGAGYQYDGIVTLNSGKSFKFTRPTNTSSYDALRVIEHEMDEVLGFGSFLNTGGSDVRPQDLFSWAAPGTRGLSLYGSRYFSIDNGNTQIVGFNQNSGGDYGDWVSESCPQSHPYVQNAVGCVGQASDVTATSPEGINLDVIGYDLVAAAAVPHATTAHAATDVWSTGFTASWDTVGGAAGYRLDVSTDSAFGSFVPGYENLDVGYVSSVDVSGLNAETTYYYRVRAYNRTGTSENSNTISVVTAAPAPTPAPTASPADAAVAFQVNALHDGHNALSTLIPPLTLKWEHDFSSAGLQWVSYPLIAQGLVIVTAWPEGGTAANVTVAAFDESSGQQVWSRRINEGVAFSAYDAGNVFVLGYSGTLQALDATTGRLRWSIDLPGQFYFTSAPTVSNGIVFTAGAESGGTVYAVDAKNGTLMWTANVMNGDDSPPAVTSDSVFVSYVCPQSYAFAPTTGQLLWHYNGACEGGGGATPVFHDGKVYIRDSYVTSNNGLILDAKSGSAVGDFQSDTPPAFSGNLAVYLHGGVLRGIDIPTSQTLWSFSGDSHLISAPLIVNGTVYVGSSSGWIYALDQQGNEIWSTQLAAAIQQPGEGNTGFAAGDGLLVVPAGSTVAVFSGDYASVSPTPTPTATPDATPTPTPTPTATASPTITPTPTAASTSSPSPAPTANKKKHKHRHRH